jgi:hypothetical protein
MVDLEQLEKTLDLWASMWQPRERELFEVALERVLQNENEPSRSLRLAALAACRAIGTPGLHAIADRAEAEFDALELEDVVTVAEPHAWVLAVAATLTHNHRAVVLLLENVVHAPDAAADAVLDRVDIRDLYAVMHADEDELLRTEAARRLARRGPHQRARLLSALGMEPEALAAELEQEVHIDIDLDAYDDFDLSFEVNVDDLGAVNA